MAKAKKSETKKTVTKLKTTKKEKPNKTKSLDPESKKIIDQLEKQIQELTIERKIDLIRQNVVDRACIVSMTDKKGIITYVNDLFCEISGYTREECIGKNQNMVRHPNMPKEVFKDLWSTVGRGNVWRGKVENLCKDGSSYHVDALISPIIGDDGKPEGYIGIRYENTSEVDAQAEILLEAESLQNAIDTGWALIEFEPDGTIIKANQNFLDALKYPDVSEIAGKHHRIFCRDEYIKSDEYKNFWTNLANGETLSGEFIRLRKDGSCLWLNASYTPVKDNQGKVFKIIKIATDISNVKAPVLEIADVLEHMSQGNLQHRFESKGAIDYVDTMGTALNMALENVSEILNNINNVSNSVASSSKELLTQSDQMQASTFESSSAIQEMADGTQQQAMQIDDVSKLIENVLVVANTTADSAQVINTAAEEGQNSAGEGLLTIKKLIKNMTDIQESAQVTSVSIDTLTERSEEIARTLNVITDIATQTNLLALNAAIEAARAGEAGRGFAVVAEEIRKLASDSRESATAIERVISDVQKDVSSASKAIESMGVSVTGGNNASNDVQDVFQSIEKSSLQTFDLSQDILAATLDQKSAINESVKNIEKIVVVAEETAAGTEQVASSSRNISTGMDEITSTSKNLSQIAIELQSSLSKFKLK